MQPVPTLCTHGSLEGAGEISREILRAPERAMETLGNTSYWSGDVTKDLCFYLEIEFGGVFTFH